MCPFFRSSATRQQVSWMHDCAASHCTNEAEAFLLEQCQQRVISEGLTQPGQSTAPLSTHSTSSSIRQHRANFPTKDRKLRRCRAMCPRLCRVSWQGNHKNSRRKLAEEARLCFRADGGRFQRPIHVYMFSFNFMTDFIMSSNMLLKKHLILLTYCITKKKLWPIEKKKHS